MRWVKEVDSKPYVGEQRVITKFALLPIRCDNGECAWLEKVNVLQQFRIIPNSNAQWRNEKFIDMDGE